jgi:hypothetical protein
MKDVLHQGRIFNTRLRIRNASKSVLLTVARRSYLQHGERNVETIQSFRIFCAVPKIFTNHVKISKIHLR